MLRLFRHIRQGALNEHRLFKYSQYALGEILLVVIGILIALQINNWNEAQNEQQQIREYLLKLSADLQSDLRMIEPVDEQIRWTMLQADYLADYVRERPVAALENAELYFAIHGIGYRSYAWNRAAMEQLKSSGAMRQISNGKLTDRISAYDALTHHLDQDFASDQSNIYQVHLMADRIINQNYPENDEINTWMDQIGDGDVMNRMPAFRDTDLFARMKKQDLPLLTDDINEVRLLVNLALTARSDLDSRVDTELPRLRNWAGEIIATIEAEYQ